MVNKIEFNGSKLLQWIDYSLINEKLYFYPKLYNLSYFLQWYVFDAWYL